VASWKPRSTPATYLALAWTGLLVTLAALWVRSPFMGDLQHFSHRLAKRGLSNRETVAVIYGLTAATGISGVLLGSLRPWQALLIGVQVLIILLVLAVFEHASSARAQVDG